MSQARQIPARRRPRRPRRPCRHPWGAALAATALGAALVLGGVPLAGAPACAEEPPLTLGELLELSRGHNPQVRQASANLEAARARREQTDSGFWPQLSGQASWERTRNEITSSGQVEGEQRQAGLSLSQSLLNVPLWSQSRASRLEAQAYAEAVRNAVNETQALVRAAYLDLLADTALVQVYEEQERDTTAFLERVKKLLAHGLAAPLEVARAGLDLAEAKRKLIEGRSTVRKRMARLAEAVGLPQVRGLPVAPWEVAPEATLARLEEQGETALIAQGLQHRPDLARLTLLAQTAQANLEAAEAGHWPTLDLQGSLGQYGEYDLASQFNSYGLFLNLPLFTGFKIRATVAERQALLRAAQENREQTALTVRREAQEAWLGLWEAQAKVGVSASQLESAQENFRLINGRHANGLATPLELSEARTQRFNALAAVQRARYGVFSALSELDRALGGGVFPGLEARP